MRFKKIALTCCLFVVLPVIGCTTVDPAQVAARQEQQRQAAIAWQREGQAMRAQIDAQQDSKCRSWGAVPGSDAYVRCRTDLERQRLQEIAQDNALSQAQFEANQVRFCNPSGGMVICY